MTILQVCSQAHIEVILENCPTIVLLYGTYLPVALLVFVIHIIISYICDSMTVRDRKCIDSSSAYVLHGFYRGNT